jgi:hypothetical protein
MATVLRALRGDLLNFQKELGNGTAIEVNGNQYRSAASNLTAKLGVGGEHVWKITEGLEGSLFGEVSASRSLSNSDTGLKGSLGFASSGNESGSSSFVTGPST